MGKLTPARELKIKEAVGNVCEMQRCKNRPMKYTILSHAQKKVKMLPAI